MYWAPVYWESVMAEIYWESALGINERDSTRLKGAFSVNVHFLHSAVTRADMGAKGSAAEASMQGRLTGGNDVLADY